MIFLFLISRPLLDLMYNYKYYQAYTYNIQNGTFTLLLILCSLIALLLGMLLSERYIIKDSIDRLSLEKKARMNFVKNLQTISLLLFLICSIFDIAMGIEKIIFIQQHTYYEYYSKFETTLPLIVKGISTMMPTALLIYLATFPHKKGVMTTLFIYMLLTIPSLIVGSRGATSEALVFCFLYLFLRQSISKRHATNEEWFNKNLKRAIFIIVPILIIYFSGYNYARFGTEKKNEMNPVVDFIYNQGVTFTVVARGYDALPNLEGNQNKNYTFGPLIDYVTRGTPAQILFNAEGLGPANSQKRAIESNSFSAAISYYLYGNQYLEGKGAGSSYIIELYADYGFIGVFVFSSLLGVLFGFIGNIKEQNIFTNIILLRILMVIYLLPRGSALGWTTFFISPQFWLPVIFCWLASKYFWDRLFNRTQY